MNTYEKKITYSYDERENVIHYLKFLMKKYHIFAFVGHLGAGKTTIIRELLRNCGVVERIASPTFSYVNIYTKNDGITFYHFDLYRIASVDEFCEQGFDEYLNQSHAWVFIEWPEVISPLLQHGVCWLNFDYHEDYDKRIVHIKCLD
jgi:tRNA threonylcarbamoyladenosine biosynthesis protein TsaE